MAKQAEKREVIVNKKPVAVFTEFNNKTNWVAGTVTGLNGKQFTFESKLFDTGSEYGIKKGRVSCLAISDTVVREAKKNYDDSLIVAYDRGWGKRAKKEDKSVFDAVMELLENSPKRFED